MFGTESTQRDVYGVVEGTAVLNVDHLHTVLAGVNSTVFAYGQTGSGKTHTMFGPNWEESLRANMASSYQRMSLPDSSFYVEQTEKHGVIPRTIYKLFESLSTEKALANFAICCSFVQIYNEKLFDLLEDRESKHPLLIRENRYSGVYVQGLTEYVVPSMEDCLTLLFRGERNRIIRQTRLNMFSSRSHTIFQIHLENTRVDAQGKFRRAKLNLCDLAGSEKLGPEADLTGKHLEELKSINLSLTTLGKVVAALSNKASHVPYRDSKLTRILQDSIGGSTRTCLIATVSPTAECADESVSTLTFANRAKHVRITALPNVINASDDALVKKLQQELQYMKDLLHLKRKGGAGDVNRQLILLKQENDKLRAIHNEWGEVERLKMENKAMRLELQKLKEGSVDSCGQMSNSDTQGQAWEGGSIFQRRMVRNSPQSVASEEPPNHSGQSFFTTISAVDITRRIEQQRRYDRERAVDGLRKSMSKEGRCPLCTLPIPCKHCKTKEELKVAEERSASAHPRTEVWSDSSSVNRCGGNGKTLSHNPYSLAANSVQYLCDCRISARHL